MLRLVIHTNNMVTHQHPPCPPLFISSDDTTFSLYAFFLCFILCHHVVLSIALRSLSPRHTHSKMPIEYVTLSMMRSCLGADIFAVVIRLTPLYRKHRELHKSAFIKNKPGAVAVVNQPQRNQV